MRIRRVIERPVPRIGMSVEDLAISLGVSPNSIYKMVEEGLLPRPRVWHRRRIWRVAEIDAALAQWPTDGDPDYPATEGAALDDWRAET